MLDNLISICSSLTYIIFIMILTAFFIIPRSSLVLFSFIIPNFLLNKELYKLSFKFFCAGLFYMFMIIILLILLIIVVRLSFENYSVFYSLKNKNYVETYHTIKLLKHIIYSLTCLLLAVLINWYYDLLLIEIPLSIYICWILGFLSSIPINTSVYRKLNNNRKNSSTKVKDYLFLKAISNSCCFYILYILLKYYFYK